MILARHKLTPPNEVMFQFMRPDRKGYRLSLLQNIRFIIKDVTGYDPYDRVTDQSQELVLPRQLFLYFAKQIGRASLAKVGNELGKDHATVMYAIKCVEKFRVLEPAYAEIFTKIEKRVKLLK
jgi:hypothetical protein